MSESRKRSRCATDEDSVPRSSPAPAKSWVQDTEHYYDDGNVLLVAGDIAFRVHAGALTKRSQALRELLSNPHYHTADLMPVVELFDHPADIRRLLGAFIYGNDLRFIKENPDFKTLSSLIRMGHKYQLEAAVDAGLEYLQPYYPSTLPEWEAKRAGPPNFSPMDHIGVVNIARLTDTPELLPAAFLHCCALDPKVLRRGFKREDGTMEKLSHDDLVTLIIAGTELIKADTLDSRSILQVADDCQDDAECRRTLMAVHEYIGGQDWEVSFKAGWRQSWKGYLEKIEMVPCDDCVDAIEEREREKLEELWDKWPAMLAIE